MITIKNPFRAMREARRIMMCKILFDDTRSTCCGKPIYIVDGEYSECSKCGDECGKVKP
jgi:hypothetical protein